MDKNARSRWSGRQATSDTPAPDLGSECAPFEHLIVVVGIGLLCNDSSAKEERADSAERRHHDDHRRVGKEDLDLDVAHEVKRRAGVVAVGQCNQRQHNLHDRKHNHDAHDQGEVEENRFVAAKRSKDAQTGQNNQEDGRGGKDGHVDGIIGLDGNVVPVGTGGNHKKDASANQEDCPEGNVALTEVENTGSVLLGHGCVE